MTVCEFITSQMVSPHDGLSSLSVILRAEGCLNWPLFTALNLALSNLWLSDKKRYTEHRTRGDCDSN